MKKLCFAFIVGVAFCVIVGCSYSAQSIRVMKSNDLQSKEFEPAIYTVPTLADLKVDPQKVMGQASGSYSEISGLKKEAITNALGQDTPSVNKPDVLVGTNFFYEISGDSLKSLKVTVMGYPARYVNFRPATESDTAFLKFNSPTKKDDEFYSVSIPSAPDEKSRYFSMKFQATPPFSGAGGNIEAGIFKNNFFFSSDFGGGNNNLGGGFSFGGRIQPISWLQIIPGGTTGFWAFFKYGYETYNDYDSYYGYNSHERYGRNEYFAWGGPFVKLLFGKGKFWGEVCDRVLFGTAFANQIMFGFTYAPSKK